MSSRLNLAAFLIAGLLATFMLAKLTGDFLSAAIVVLVLLVTAAALLAPPAREHQARQRR